MWPVEGGPASPSGGPPPLDARARRRLLFGGAGVLLALALGSVLSIRSGQSGAPLAGSSSVHAATLWFSDGADFRAAPVAGNGPLSNHADMAFDPGRGQLVLWDHGCAHLVLGFTGGCDEEVDETWTWAGGAWRRRTPRTEPVQAGAAAMVYDPSLQGVVYANGSGQVWIWTGSDWRRMDLRPPDALGRAGVAAVGWQAVPGRLVWLTVASTWSWDGTGWSRLGGGIDAADAAEDSAGLVDDPGRGQLLYVGAEFTWTFESGGWRRHPQPAFSPGSGAAFDPHSGSVTLIDEDSQACDRSACRGDIWTWDGAGWARQPDAGPDFPLGRSGSFSPPVAFDSESRQLAVLISAS